MIKLKYDLQKISEKLYAHKLEVKSIKKHAGLKKKQSKIVKRKMANSIYDDENQFKSKIF